MLLIIAAVTMAVGGGAAEPAADGAFFEVEVTGTNEPVAEGEPLVVNATITNTGTAEDSQQIHLKNADDRIVDSIAHPPLTLAPGERERVTLTWETERGDAGSGEFSVQSNDDATHRSNDVQRGTFLEMAVDDLESPITAGETLSVPITVTNVGEGSETPRVRFALDGTTRDERAVGLDPGETERTTLTWESNASHVGEWTLVATAGNERETETIVIDEANESTDGLKEANESTDGGSTSGGTPPANVIERNTGLLGGDGSVQFTGSDVERITVGNDSATGLVVVNRLRDVPDGVADVDDPVERYRIDVPDELANDGATIEFTLPATALDGAGTDAVGVVYWTGEEWTELDAEATSHDDEVRIEAETPGFSLFAVTTTGTDDRTEEPMATETSTNTEASTNTPAPTDTPTSTNTEASTDASDSTPGPNASTTTPESNAAVGASSQEVPGFGVVLTLVALTIAAVVGGRRHRRD